MIAETTVFIELVYLNARHVMNIEDDKTMILLLLLIDVTIVSTTIILSSSFHSLIHTKPALVSNCNHKLNVGKRKKKKSSTVEACHV